MKNTFPAAVGVLAGLSILGCASAPRAAKSEQVRKTADGGTILLRGGEKPQEAAKLALAAMEKHCKGLYEVVETARMGTGDTIGGGVASYGSWNEWSSQLYGLSIVYVCRKPVNTDLNESVRSLAFLGLACTSDNDCGGLPCARRGPSAASGVCAKDDGFLPGAGQDETCAESSDCMPPLKCYKTLSRNYCSK
jgi:hypothetical protein